MGVGQEGGLGQFKGLGLDGGTGGGGGGGSFRWSEVGTSGGMDPRCKVRGWG